MSTEGGKPPPDGPDKKEPLVPAGLPDPDAVDEAWDGGLPEPDYAAEAARWREELQAAVGLAEEAEKKEAAWEGKQPAATAAEAPSADPDADADMDSVVADAPAAAPKPKLAAIDRPKPPRAKPPRRDDAPPGPWKKVAIAGALVLVLVIIFVALGTWNARDYYLVCGAEEISAEQGRGFPPWGSRRLSGAEWQPIQIPANAECVEFETTDRAELEEAFMTALVDQANAMLTSRNPTNIELAQKQLEQGLLLTRDAERRNQRRDIERLLGDVEYWRGAAQVQQVIDQLKGAAGRFDGAAVKRPRHQSDSSSWAGFARATAEELRLGPPELRPARPTDPNAPPPFTGTGPDSPVQLPDAGVPGPDAGPGTLLNPPTDAPPPPPDAGLPGGGVLL